MLKIIATVALATLAVAAMAPAANAAQRHWTVTGAHGTTTGSVDRYCFDGACYGEAQITGPNGKTLQTSGMCTRTEPYVWDCKGTATGPQGGTKTGAVHVVFD